MGAGIRAVATAMTVACGCAGPSGADVEIPIEFIAEDGVGGGLPGVSISLGERKREDTNEAGFLSLRWRGPDRSRVPVSFGCPADHRAVGGASALQMRRVTDPGTGEAVPIRFPIRCEATTRSVVLAIAASGAPLTPVLVNGRRVAVTDGDGTAHATLRARPGRHLRVVLDTSAQPTLAPASPELVIRVGEHDEIYVLEETFRSRAPVPRRRPRSKHPRSKRPVKVSKQVHREEPQPALVS